MKEKISEQTISWSIRTTALSVFGKTLIGSDPAIIDLDPAPVDRTLVMMCPCLITP
jgi:hypothetical protein